MRAKAVTVLAGTILQAECHEFTRIPFRPRYPIEPLPESTRAHLRSVARLSYPKFVQQLHRSRTFSLLLDEELTPAEGTAYARTFLCHLVTIDGQLPSDDAPRKLCVKLFDDAAASVPNHTESPNIPPCFGGFKFPILLRICSKMRQIHIRDSNIHGVLLCHIFTALIV
jgi:hypothetical protein